MKTACRMRGDSGGLREGGRRRSNTDFVVESFLLTSRIGRAGRVGEKKV